MASRIFDFEVDSPPRDQTKILEHHQWYTTINYL
jgi:hypothetical protein